MCVLSRRHVADSGVAASCGRPVWLTEGDTLYLRWQSNVAPLDRCSAMLPDGTEVALPDGGGATADGDVAAAGSAYAYVGDGYRSGQCGLRTDNVTAGVGDWTLVAAADGRSDRYTSRVTCIGKHDDLFILHLIFVRLDFALRTGDECK